MYSGSAVTYCFITSFIPSIGSKHLWGKEIKIDKDNPEPVLVNIPNRKLLAALKALASQSQRPGPRGRSIATGIRCPGSPQRIVRPFHIP
jgi:hypothetical protein